MKRGMRFMMACALALAGCGESTAVTEDAGGSDGGTDAARGPLVLAPGDVVELPVSANAAGVRLATPKGDEKFMVVLASTRFDTSGDELAYSMKLDGAPADAATPVPVTGCSIDGAAWANAMLPVETPPSGPAPMVGDTRKLYINGGSFDAQVAAVGKLAVVWVDVTQAHPANLDQATIDDFLADFDNLILPRERTLYGMESDLDADGRIGLVFTSLTKATAVAFFTGCDLGLAGCPRSNHGEFLYVTPPKFIDPPYNTPAAIKEILAHELGHLIHFNRKVLRNKLMSWDDSGYMIEGFGALMQDLSGFQAGNLYVTVAGLDGIGNFALGETLVDGTPYDLSRDGVLRGVSYLFTRWLYDRGGGDVANMDGTITSKGGPAFIRALLDSPDSVATALGTVGKVKSMADLGMDFYTAVGLSNRDRIGDAAPANACFRYLPIATDPKTMKQRGADLFTTFHGMMMNGPDLQLAGAADGKLLAGGVEYIEVDATPGAPETTFGVAVTAGDDPQVRVRVARIH